MKLEIRSKEKSAVFAEVEAYLEKCKLGIVDKDATRPWGGFFVINEDEAVAFGKLFFPEIELSTLKISGKLSPKILLVEPGKKLSWQFHHRRAEIWRVIAGKVEVITSATDIETEKVILKHWGVVRLAQGQRHRAAGLDEWGIIAEIWQHTKADDPSDEEDIVRVQDDFGR